MKKILVVFALFCTLFFAVSCDSGLKFENPNDPNNKISQSKTGELGGECYRNKTCNEGLICDEESNSCVKAPESTEDNDISDTGDSGTPDNDMTSDDNDDVQPAPDSDTIPSPDNDTETHDGDTDTAPEEPTPTQKCQTAGGTYANNSCTKEADCSGLPANAAWNGNGKFTQTLNQIIQISHGAWLSTTDA